MELVADYLFQRYIGKKDPLPFPDYLLPQNRHKNDFWITQQGECVYPWDMDDRHLVNTVRVIHRGNPRIPERYKEGHGDQHILYGKSPWATGKGKRHKGNVAMTQYFQLWEHHRIYMLLRREITLRGLEEHL